MVLGALVAPQGVQAQEQPHYCYYYFDEPMPLVLETAKLVIFQESSADAGSEPRPANERLQAYGIGPADVEPHPIKGLSVVATPLGLRGETELQNLVASLAAEPEFNFVSPVFLDKSGDPVIISQHIHVGFADDVSTEDAEAILADLVAGTIEQRNWARMQGVYRLQCSSKDGFEVLALANGLAQLAEVEFAESDMILTVHKHLTPDDPYYTSGYLWGLHNYGQSGGTVDMDMDAPEAWDITIGNPSISVVILDDGVQQDHPDINQIAGADFTENGTEGGPFNECDNHGTAVAGCTSAIINNGIGVVGIAPGCKVASAKIAVATVPCDGTMSGYSSWMVDALDWAQSIGARVTSASWGGTPNGALTEKYDATYAAGLIHFAASGNEGSSSIIYPGSLDSVNAVGAVDRDGDRCGFSSWGVGLAFVAPGEEIYTTDRTGSDGHESGDYYGPANGTSYSSPYAAGVAAMVLSVDSSLTPAEVENAMNTTCKDRGSSGYDYQYGWGIVQAYDAMQSVLQPLDPDPAEFWFGPTGASPARVDMGAVLTTGGIQPAWYFFECVSGGPGCDDSGWVPTRIYYDFDLEPDTLYSYRVQARDSATIPNETGHSDTESTATRAQIPAAPVLGNETCESMEVTIGSDGNPAITTYAIHCSDTSDDSWDDQYVDATGNPSATRVYQTKADWGTTTVVNLTELTTYTFAVNAKNQEGVETNPGPSASLATPWCSSYGDGDFEPDDDVDLADLAAFQRCFGQEGIDECAPGNMTGDEMIDLEDFAEFYASLTGPS